MKTKKTIIFHIFLLSVLTFLAYSNVINAGFLFDDEHFIVRNEYIRDISKVKDIFLNSATGGSGLKDNFYRPLGTFSWLIIYHVFGLNPAAFHLENIFLHILNGLLVYLVLFSIFLRLNLKDDKDDGPRGAHTAWGAFFGSAFFLLHPLQTLASYCSATGDLLSFFFLMCALYVYKFVIADEPVGGQKAAADPRIRSKNKLFFTLFFILAALAILAKERAVMMILLLPLFDISFPGAVSVNPPAASKDRRLARAPGNKGRGGDITEGYKRIARFRLIAICLVGTAVAAWLYLKYLSSGSSLSFDFYRFSGKQNIYSENILVRIYTFFCAFLVYLRLIVVPFPLYMERAPFVFASFFHYKVIAGFLILLSGFVLSAFSYRKKRLFFFAYLWALLALAPTSGLIPVNYVVMEYWLYFSLFGVAFLVAAAAIRIPRSLPVIVPALIAFGVMTYSHNAIWKSPEAFYGHILKYNPDSVKANNNIAMVYSDKGEFDKAILHYRRSIAIDDSFPQPHHNLARIYLAKNDVNNALMEFSKALAIDPNFIFTHQELAGVYYLTGEKAKAEYHAARVRRILGQ